MLIAARVLQGRSYTYVAIFCIRRRCNSKRKNSTGYGHFNSRADVRDITSGIRGTFTVAVIAVVIAIIAGIFAIIAGMYYFSPTEKNHTGFSCRKYKNDSLK